jgi:glutamate racemase
VYVNVRVRSYVRHDTRDTARRISIAIQTALPGPSATVNATPSRRRGNVLAQVGIFDSGLGGLTVARALRQRAPALPILYFADTARFPYGACEPVELCDRVLTVARSLVDRGCSTLVVACNTASSAALEQLRAELPVPVVGMEPPLKPAAARSTARRVIVLATAGTVAGERLARLEASHASGVTVHTIPMPGLADLVESGRARDPAVTAMLAAAIEEPLRLGADVVALGCTHYGFLQAVLADLLPADVTVIDAADPVARRTLAVLEQSGRPALPGAALPIAYDVSGSNDAFIAAVTCLREQGEPLPPLVRARPALSKATSDRGTDPSRLGATT